MRLIMNKWEEFLKIYLDLDFETYFEIVDDIMSINRNNLDDELENHARVFSYYSGLYEQSKKDFEIENLDLTYKQKQLQKEIEDSYTGKRLTALVMETRLGSNEVLQSLLLELENKRFKLNLLKAIVSAFSAKKDMLVQLSANCRAEKNIYS